MAEPKLLLQEVVDKIAMELKYSNYKIHLTPINSGGTNFTSQLFIAKLSAPGKDDINLFAKAAVIAEDYRTFLTYQVFETETLFYTKICSRFRELEDLYKFSEEDKLLLPKYYGGTTECMKETLVLEDLAAAGFKPFDRFKCVDWVYASKCVSFLAKLHALSIRYERDYPEEYAELIEKFKISVATEAKMDYLAKAAGAAIEVVDDEYKGRLTKFFKDQMKDEILITYYNPPHKITMIHGDFRPSNVLHKTDKNGKLEVVLVDYQICQRGNPVIDLLYFLICATDEDFRGRYMNQYFEHYYNELSKNLRKLDVNPDEVYKKEDFDADVKTLLPFGIMFAVQVLPVVTADVDDAPRPEDGIDLEVMTSFKPADLFRDRFNGIVRDYIKLGIL